MRYITLLLVIAACATDPFAPPVDGERFTPPESWRFWMVQVAYCAGRGDGFDSVAHFDRIRWFRVARPVLYDSAISLWSPPHDIYLSDSVLSLDVPGQDWYVKHEMLHDLLAGDWNHQRAEWRDCP